VRSIRVRLTASYALSATATLAILFTVGYKLLENQLSDGLDRLVTGQFREIKARLGDEVGLLSPDALARRMAEINEYSSALFYIEIEAPGTGINYRSRNLLGHAIPDVRGQRVFDAAIPGVGDMRAHEFLLPPFDITIATPLTQLRESMAAYGRVCISLLLGMALFSTAIGFGLSRLVLSPLRLISDTARRIRSDNLSERIAVSAVKDEISDLASLLNQTFDRIEIAFGQIRRFSDEASHELKTPLCLIRLHAEKMLADPELLPAHTEAVAEQLEELHRLNQIIDELLFLSRAEAEAIVFDLQPRDPRRLLESFEQDATVLAEHYGCRFQSIHDGKGLVAFEEKWIRQVLLNGLTNALNVSPRGELVTVRSNLSESIWRVSIEDQGPGLNPEQREKMFERFVRYHAATGGDRGSGLGLAICKKIIELHGGRIYASPNPSGHGLQLSFEIPVVLNRSNSSGGAARVTTFIPV
jgi:signal transduction histidine kinase